MCGPHVYPNWAFSAHRSPLFWKIYPKELFMILLWCGDGSEPIIPIFGVGCGTRKSAKKAARPKGKEVRRSISRLCWQTSVLLPQKERRQKTQMIECWPSGCRDGCRSSTATSKTKGFAWCRSMPKPRETIFWQQIATLACVCGHNAVQLHDLMTTLFQWPDWMNIHKSQVFWWKLGVRGYWPLANVMKITMRIWKVRWFFSDGYGP